MKILFRDKGYKHNARYFKRMSATIPTAPSISELKEDKGLLVVSQRSSDDAVKIETFPIGQDNILTCEEAIAQGCPIMKPTSTKKIGVWCSGIGKRFAEYVVVSTPKEITSSRKRAEKQTEEERKRIWVSILRELNRYTDAELNAHYEASSQEWRNWCNDAVLFYAYNAVIFKKGVPCFELPKEKIAEAH